MDCKLSEYQRLSRAIIIQSIKDTVTPFGFYNNRQACKDAFNFLFNKQTESYQGFCEWCDLSGMDPEYWHRLALMFLAYELNFKPWLRMRVTHFLRGKENLSLLKTYYCQCLEKDYINFFGEFYDE